MRICVPIHFFLNDWLDPYKLNSWNIFLKMHGFAGFLWAGRREHSRFSPPSSTCRLQKWFNLSSTFVKCIGVRKIKRSIQMNVISCRGAVRISEKFFNPEKHPKFGADNTVSILCCHFPLCFGSKHVQLFSSQIHSRSKLYPTGQGLWIWPLC